ncbi:hypothetical protein ACFPM1_14225 [Halorubrum rubrum]|uniref:RING-type E3 ubiquitin transferase n=1 Tax=Halorubrum rubrum TaxID=1126240 RepID=A0ABD5R4S7_9EURY|nr:hypothetical protein [Halorubrum rubrum]
MRRDPLHDRHDRNGRIVPAIVRDDSLELGRPASMYLTLFGALLVGLGLAMAWYGLRPLAVLPRLLRAEVRHPDAAREAADGEFVAVRGTARAAGETLSAPFTGTDCLGFEFEVTERQPFAVGLPWLDARLDDGVATRSFVLEGPGGDLAVRPSSRRFALDTASTVVRVGATETPPDRIRRFVDTREGLDPVAGWVAAIPLFGARRYIERRIDPDGTYLVAGRVDRGEGRDGLALAGDLVITDRSIRGFVLSRLRRAAFPLLVGILFVAIGLWGIAA